MKECFKWPAGINNRLTVNNQPVFVSSASQPVGCFAPKLSHVILAHAFLLPSFCSVIILICWRICLCLRNRDRETVSNCEQADTVLLKLFSKCLDIMLPARLQNKWCVRR